ncbi:DUF695 domain-containing protein [Alcanivorax sp.]|uniref:DUF695 domain-containing protein n=1 Tax=Alcanivorax sp. TaxID=1872427 RepID=UPI0025B8617D|nr:DUF695 domain-containing protein [Alcanivorax sp.]
MKKFTFVFLLLGFSFMSYAGENWVVAETHVDGKPVIYKFIHELPDEAQRKKLPWLAVVSWKYDGSETNGLPPSLVNDRMIELENGLEAIEGRKIIYLDVYTATGNNLKEFVFYIADREEFMEKFNESLSGHKPYPIGINFYEDKAWKDLNELLVRAGRG